MHTHSTPAAARQTWRVPLWAWAPIALAVVAEASVNALRAYGLGQKLEHFTIEVALLGSTHTVSILGAVLVLAAIAISLSQARAAWVAFKPGALARQRTLAAPVALLLLAVSVSALSLTLLEAQRGKTGDEGGQRTAYDIAKADYDKAADELKRLEGARTPAEVQAAMSVAPVDRTVFRRTKECNDVTRQDSFEACKPILELRQEMAGAIRKIELEQKLPGLKTTLDALPRPAEPSAFELLMGSVWGWIMGLAVVLVATFGAPLFAVPVESKAATQQTATGATVATEPRQPTASETAQTSFHADDLAATRATVLGTPHSVLPFARRNGRNRDNGRNSGNGGNPGNRPRRPKPDNPGNAGPYTGRVFSRTEAERDIVTMLASGATVASQDDLAARWSVDKGTVSRWLKHMREQGLVPAAQRVGRCHRLVAAE